MAYPVDSPMYKEFHERKQLHPELGLYCRLADCEIAEKLFGFKWLEFPQKKQDFCGYHFSWVLTPPESYLRKDGSPGVYRLDGAYILEPDTRVRNYTSDLGDALEVARRMGYTDIAVRPTEAAMAADICRRAMEDKRKIDNITVTFVCKENPEDLL